jgi:hypothetical protein
MREEMVFNTNEGDPTKTMHTKLEERLRFETLLAEISAHFINLPAEANVDRQTCIEWGIGSLVNVPVVFGEPGEEEEQHVG